MRTDTNKQLVARWYEAFNRNNVSALDEVFSSDYVNHETTAPNGAWPHGPEGPRNIIATYRTAFPDLQFTIEEQLADGDRVLTRWTARATHTGPLMNIPPTGRSAVVTGSSIERIASDKIAETWINLDMLGLLSQLGVIPNNA